jgi:predicted ATPase
MFRIKELYLKGFKNPDREVKIQFAEAPITIIYGENGSGKTTLLQVIQAIFKQDIEFLKSQNISLAKVTYELNQVIYTIEISTQSESYTISDEEKFNQLNSVLFGIHRGVSNKENEINRKIFKEMTSLVPIMYQLAYTKSANKELIFAISSFQKLMETANKNLDNLAVEEKRHNLIDNLEIRTIEYVLRNSFDKGAKAVLEGINNAFFSTIDSAIVGVPDITLPTNFQHRFNEKKGFFKSFIENQQPSTTKQKLQEFLINDAPDINNESPLFKTLLNNMLEAAEKDERENIDLKAITTLVRTFNEFVIHQKKLVLNAVEAYISFPNGQRHSLGDLSSGERHLLSFLTLFLIIARDRNFFLIDEPEISLSMKWQRRLLTLLSEFSPNSQIIVATHSPAIANRNYAQQVELI